MLILPLSRELPFSQRPLGTIAADCENLQELTYDYAIFFFFSGMGHSINQAVLSNVESFITRVKAAGASRHDEL